MISQKSLSQRDYSTLLSKTKLRGSAAIEASVIMHDPNMKTIILFIFVMSFA